MVDFPKMHEFPWMSDFVSGFAFPKELIAELKDLYPEWRDLHDIALKNDDSGLFWSLLYEYHGRLATITPEDIVRASANGDLPKLVAQAREAIRFSEYISSIEQRFFPERIRAR